MAVVGILTFCHTSFLQSFDEEKDITGVRIPPLEMVIYFLSPSKDFHVPAL